MPADQEQHIEIPIDSQLGIYDAVAPTSLPVGGYLLKKNAYMSKNGANAKRPGSKVVTTNALAAAIPFLTVYEFPNSVAVGAAPTLLAVGNALSTLPSGTYYARYTYVTDYGETAASAESSVVVPPALANPTVAPTLAKTAAGATLPTATYFVAYTWKNAVGETMVSPESSIAITLGERLDITVPALPSGATSLSIYAGTTTGVLKFQYNTPTLSTFINIPLTTIQSPPVANTCIVANLRIVVPAIPFHANSINVYISSTTNAEKKEYNTTTLATDQIIPLVGTVAYPVTNTTAFPNELLASSGTSLYSFYNADLRPATMTNAFASSDIYTVGFTNKDLTSILFITDGGAIKKYNGSAVALITPAADDVAPAPANGMTAINLLNPVYCWVYAGYLMVSNGKDVAYYSKKYYFDYFPTTFFSRWVRNNDYMTGCGIAFGDVCMVPFRRGWGVLNGTDDTNFAGNKFLNTISGNIAPRAIAKLTYPDGSQSVAYLSDDGVFEIFDTGFIDASGSGTRNYATRSLMKDKFDFTSIGFTEAEKIGASAYFDSILNMYILTIYRGTNKYAIVYDVRNREWTGKWENIKAEMTVRWNNTLYYAGETKLLHAYDATLATDYDDLARTTGTIVDWDCYLDIIMLENSGFQSYLDYLIVNAKNYPTTSTIDITIVGTSDTSVYLNAVQSTYATWDVSLWDFAVLVNLDFSTIVGAPAKILVKKRAYLYQIRMQNNRNELVELYKLKLIGRTSGN